MKRRFAPALYANVHQALRALADRDEGAEQLEVLNEYIRIVRDHVAPLLAIFGLADRHLDDAEIQRLPVGADQEALGR